MENRADRERYRTAVRYLSAYGGDGMPDEKGK